MTLPVGSGVVGGMTLTRANVAAARLASSHVIIEVIGFNVLAEHWAAVAQATVEGTMATVGFYQMFLVNLAREIHSPHIKTGRLYYSITPVDANEEAAPTSFIQFNGNDIWADVGAGGDVVGGPGGTADPHAYLQEFGYWHVWTGNFIQNPYMLPALDATEPSFVKAMSVIAKLADEYPQGELPMSIQQRISKYRSMLYSYSRAMGDVQVFAQSPFIGATRGAVLSASRALGDLNASMRGGLGMLGRVQARVMGRWATGGFRVNLAASLAFGAVSTRIYNRWIGREFGMGLRELSITRG